MIKGVGEGMTSGSGAAQAASTRLLIIKTAKTAIRVFLIFIIFSSP